MSHPPQQDLYRDDPRLELLPMIPRDARSVLDVGCGAGGFGPTLRSALGPEARLVGVEPVPSQATRARVGHGFDEVLDGYVPDALRGRSDSFDLVCYVDVLEHVVDPWGLLGETREWLTPGGRVLAAIPNIQFAPVMWQLLRGRWDYADWGTLDRTHLRFFTRATMIEMFENAGYRVTHCSGTNSVEGTWATDPNRVKRLLKRGLLPLLRDSRFLHFVIVAEPQRLS
jgi:2-polyprenyl-3-methyl-5-hydroxy-6-metoxy-1,4-benzoquinol methylase